jgi:hypothetical protein
MLLGIEPFSNTNRYESCICNFRLGDLTIDFAETELVSIQP